MRWWRIGKRDADLEREINSDLELEEEEQQERGLPPRKPAAPPCVLSAIPLLFASKLISPGVRNGSKVF